MNGCEEFAERLNLVAGGCADREETREVNLHLEGCPTCRERMNSMQELCGNLRSLARSADAHSPSEGLHNRIVRELRGLEKPASKMTGRRVFFVAAGLAAACLILTVQVRHAYRSTPAIPDTKEVTDQIGTVLFESSRLRLGAVDAMALSILDLNRLIAGSGEELEKFLDEYERKLMRRRPRPEEIVSMAGSGLF